MECATKFENTREYYSCSKENYSHCSSREHPKAQQRQTTLGSACINQPWSFDRTQYDMDMMKKFNHC